MYLLYVQSDLNYTVHGIVRKNSLGINHLQELESSERIHLHYGDTTDSIFLLELVKTIKPDEIYNFAAQSHV